MDGEQAVSQARAEKAIVTDFDQAFWQDVLQEAVDELLGGKGAGSEIAGQGDCDQKDLTNRTLVLILSPAPSVPAGAPRASGLQPRQRVGRTPKKQLPEQNN